MVRLAIFTPTLEGGVGNVIVKLANGLSATQKFKVDLLALNVKGNYHLNLIQRVRLVNFQKLRAIKAFYPLIVYLKKEKPQILLSVSFHANIVAILARAVSPSKTKIVISEHIALNEALRNLNFLKRLLMTFLIKIFYRLADKIVCVSEEATDILKNFTKLSKEKMCTIYNPIINESIYEMASIKPNHHFSNENVPIIISIGRLTKQKDFSTLIRAYSIVKEKINSKLIILGEGEERQNL